MLSEEQVLALMRDIESDRVERTVSTKKTDKFAEAVCAFANDLPNHRQPGYLLIGVDDHGRPSGLRADDEFLRSLGDLRSNGRIQPLPVMTVERVALSDGDVVVVQVMPSDLPPVRFDNRVWIRVGPRRALASEQDERILSERRQGLARTFDARPCRDATIANLALDLFVVNYLPRAVSPEIIEENHRDIELKLASLRFFDLEHRRPTNAGILVFGTDPASFFETAFVHLLRFPGTDVDAAPVEEHRVRGDLNSLLQKLYELTDIYNPQRTAPESETLSKTARDYPIAALREYINNAVIHRNYEAGGPVRISWFDDRIEIQSPGGLFGEVTPTNFPNRYAYRNPVLAEAMKVLGYVERFGSGIRKAELALKRNGNPSAEFAFDTFVQVTVRRRP